MMMISKGTAKMDMMKRDVDKEEMSKSISCSLFLGAVKVCSIDEGSEGRSGGGLARGVEPSVEKKLDQAMKNDKKCRSATVLPFINFTTR